MGYAASGACWGGVNAAQGLEGLVHVTCAGLPSCAGYAAAGVCHSGLKSAWPEGLAHDGYIQLMCGLARFTSKSVHCEFG